MATFVEKLSKILEEQGAITHTRSQALQHAFKESSKPSFDHFLLSEGLIERDDLLKALAQYYQLPSFDAIGYFFQRHLLTMFPKDFLLRNGVIPIEVDENMLIVCASNPADPSLLEKLGRYVSYDIRFRVGLYLDISDAVKEFYEKSLTEVDEDEDSVKEHFLLHEERHVIRTEEGLEELRDWEEREGK